MDFYENKRTRLIVKQNHQKENETIEEGDVGKGEERCKLSTLTEEEKKKRREKTYSCVASAAADVTGAFKIILCCMAPF